MNADASSGPVDARSSRSAACGAGAWRALRALLLLALVGGRRATGAAARLDRPGGVAAVLGPALALGLCHRDRRAYARVGACRAEALSSIVAYPRSGRSCGKAVERRLAEPGRRARLGRTAAWRATASTTGAQRRRAMVLDVGRHLGELAAARATGRSRAARSRPSSPPSRIRAAIARASSSVAGGASSTLNATSGGRAATSTAPAVGCSRGGPKSGASSPAVDPALELGRAAAAQLGARAAAASSP